MAYRLGDRGGHNTQCGRLYYDLFDERPYDAPRNKNYI